MAPETRLKVDTSSMLQFRRETGMVQGVRQSTNDMLGAMLDVWVTPLC